MKKTKEIIIDAFWQLLEEKTFNKITVQNYGQMKSFKTIMNLVHQ